MVKNNNCESPRWFEELKRFNTIKSQYVICGNIHDLYPRIDNETNETSFEILTEYFRNVLKEEGYNLFIEFNPHRLRVYTDNDESVRNFFGPAIPTENLTPQQKTEIDKQKPIFTEQQLNSLVENGEIENINPQQLTKIAMRVHDIEIGMKVCEAGIRTVLLVNNTSRFKQIFGNLFIDEFFYTLFKLSLEAYRHDDGKFNLVVLMIEKENDIPEWYTFDNPRIKLLRVEKPDENDRDYIIRYFGKDIKDFEKMEKEDKKGFNKRLDHFKEQTSGLFSEEIKAISRLASSENKDFDRIPEVINLYKFGVPYNPWNDLNRDKIKDGEKIISGAKNNFYENFPNKVFGQNDAIKHSMEVIMRSYFGLSGSQFSIKTQRPKGVLFFAGPTGVGKTELAKSIVKLIFNEDTSFIRFDMSEFKQEHTLHRLIGAPPGYVGYDVGGELTNAVKKNPFSLILFDEIEKAHPRILDIFLQILDDGRLTSSRGETVFFTESIIVFTSNKGMKELFEDIRYKKLSKKYADIPEEEKVKSIKFEMDRIPDIEMEKYIIETIDNYPYDEMESFIKNQIREYFENILDRREIYNRIGNNISVFRFIDIQTAHDIAENMLKKSILKLEDSCQVRIIIDEQNMKNLIDRVTRDRSKGGRGIGNEIEKYFINPLSRKLFDIEGIKPGENKNIVEYHCHYNVVKIDEKEECQVKLVKK